MSRMIKKRVALLVAALLASAGCGVGEADLCDEAAANISSCTGSEVGPIVQRCRTQLSAGQAQSLADASCEQLANANHVGKAEMTSIELGLIGALCTVAAAALIVCLGGS